VTAGDRYQLVAIDLAGFSISDTDAGRVLWVRSEGMNRPFRVK
jgi:hypothetical protein